MARATPPLRQVTGLLTPGAVLLLAAWAVQKEEVVRSAAAPYALFFCCGTLAAAILLSWYYDQSRLLCLASASALTVWALSRWSADPSAARLTAVLLLPLNFILFASFKERGVMTFEGFLQIGVVIAQVLGVIWVHEANSQSLELFLKWGQRSDAWTTLPVPTVLAFAIAFVTLLAFVIGRRTKVESGLLWALTLTFLGVNQMLAPDGHLIYLGTAGLVLVFAVLEHGFDIAYRDELTGLPGRRAFNRIMEQLSGKYALAMCDVDQFKKLNDTYGHETGDQILKMVAVKLSQVGGGGRAFRYGGEEFLLVFKGLSARQAEPFVESVRTAIADARFVLRGADRPAQKPARPENGPQKKHHRIEITVSIGVAGRSKRHSSPELVLDAADAALYRAKEAGRNCVKLAESTP
ncbi:MAG TPA: GGDEF domain-containing protein [Vicinamibacterales bacterium]|nr:GGDEF domain-containing protein [Vicinamibacterales bacterium]